MENSNINVNEPIAEVKQKVLCECGKLVSPNSKSMHIKSAFHQRNAQKLEVVVEDRLEDMPANVKMIYDLTIKIDNAMGILSDILTTLHERERCK